MAAFLLDSDLILIILSDGHRSLSQVDAYGVSDIGGGRPAVGPWAGAPARSLRSLIAPSSHPPLRYGAPN